MKSCRYTLDFLKLEFPEYAGRRMLMTNIVMLGFLKWSMSRKVVYMLMLT
ncbi:hypothetical protein XCR_2152 [Xanthomonas campestris pv. raphani 756C]|nr:hypothetical protein XCR_2152 [Xanthomonas campestris pv. raphani 756C]